MLANHRTPSPAVTLRTNVKDVAPKVPYLTGALAPGDEREISDPPDRDGSQLRGNGPAEARFPPLDQDEVQST